MSRMFETGVRRSVLVFAGADPSGGAGIAADILAIAANGAHALPVITALTVQDNDRVYEVLPVDGEVLRRQARALMNKVSISAVKIGIPGNRANAEVIAELIVELRTRQPGLPVVLDPVLASGAGDALTSLDALVPLLPLATLIVPNLPEAAALGEAAGLHGRGCADVLVTGGHGPGEIIVNRWLGAHGEQEWGWLRLPGSFHGSGCTLASAIAARLALGEGMERALDVAQHYCHQSLVKSFSIAPGQRIPLRTQSHNTTQGAS